MGKNKERIAGLEAVETHKKLMVLGKPGSGKTTFLKYLAISCLNGKFHSELVPIFITLKTYSEAKGSPSLEEYILDDIDFDVYDGGKIIDGNLTSYEKLKISMWINRYLLISIAIFYILLLCIVFL